MIIERKYCNDVKKKLFNCWIYDNDYIDGDVKVRDHCHITEKYRDSPH